MDIIDPTVDNSDEKVLCIKEESEENGGRGRGRSKASAKRSQNRTTTTTTTSTTTTTTTIHPATAQDHIQYELEQEGSGGMAVAYRVVQLTEDLGTASYTGSTSPLHGSPTTVYTNSLNGGMCVLSSPHFEVYPLSPNQKSFIPRVHDDSNKSIVTKDDKRRATHNEVERRRRDKINNWIMKLSKIIPDCKQESGKGGFESQSKGCILAKACDYISELKDVNKRLMISIKQHEQLMVEMDAMTRKLEDVTQENELLKATLAQHGLPLP